MGDRAGPAAGEQDSQPGAHPAARADDLAQPECADPTLPARIEIFNNLFMHIAEQMGEVLKSTAQSVHIKERLD
jgi:5-oxoprolinase (ATP-hydrolysing)